jgi:hypothetical protein
MSESNRFEVVNPEGWRREYTLERPIVYVGSQAGADILLPSAEVAARHLQFVPSALNRNGCRVINLSSTDLTLLTPDGNVLVAPRQAAEVGDGDKVQFGGYTMIFHSGQQTSAVIQARTDLASNRLDIDRPLDGGLYIRNGGDKAGVQFVVEVEGVDPHHLQIEPGPVLFPGVEKRVGFRLTHPRKAKPVAGEQVIVFQVTAPSDYPGESATVKQRIVVAPFFAHRLRLVAVEREMSDFTLVGS